VGPLISINPKLRQAIALLQMDAGDLGLTGRSGSPKPLPASARPWFSAHQQRVDPAQDLPVDGTSLIAHVLEQLPFCRIEPNERHATQDPHRRGFAVGLAGVQPA
jgi:hypothetical protein